MTTEPRFVHATRVAVVDSGTRVALLRLDELRTPPVILNDSAAVIWRLFASSRTVAEAAEELATGLGVSIDQVLPDVDGVVEELRRMRLVQAPDAPPTAGR